MRAEARLPDFILPDCVCSICSMSTICYHRYMKASSPSAFFPTRTTAADRALWQPEVGRLVTQVINVPEAQRAQAAAALVDSINEALHQAGLELQISVSTEPSSMRSNSEADVPPAGAASADAVRRAQARGEARLVTWTQDGTLLPGAEVCKAWGIKRQTLDAARARGEVFSLWVKGQHWYPAEMLKFERATFARIHAALGDIDPSGKLLFLLHRHGALGGRTPADACPDRLDEVLRLAASWSRH